MSLLETTKKMVNQSNKDDVITGTGGWTFTD